MEDAVSELRVADASPVPFGKIEAALRGETDRPREGTADRALTATVVAIGPADRLEVVIEPLQRFGNAGAIRAIVIPDDTAKLESRVAGNLVVLSGLKHTYIDNAVAALRLSSLPTVIWWRGGPLAVLERLDRLADRIVLDAEPPQESWRCAVDRLDRSAFTDMRWARLTRWRALMAQFFDMPDVRDATSSFKRLRIEGSDRPSAQLFAAWMQTSMQWGDSVAVDIVDVDGPPVRCIELGNGTIALNLRIGHSGTCVTSAGTSGHQTRTSRVVRLEDESLASLLADELRVRSRDEAFERALQAVAKD